jgi:hypothetical protein
MPNLNPPTDDPKLPSFECEEYRKNKPILKRLQHCWYGGFHRLPIAEAELYLPRNFDEDDREYKRRLMRSHYENSFKRTIAGFSGAFSKFDLSEIKLPEEFFDNSDISIIECTLLQKFTIHNPTRMLKIIEIIEMTKINSTVF